MVIYFMIIHTYDRYEHLYAHNCNMGSHSLLQQSTGLFKNQNLHSLSSKSMLVWFRCSGKIFLVHALSNSRDIHCAFMLKNETLSTTMFWICHIHKQGAYANFLSNAHTYFSKDKSTVAGSKNIILKTQ